MELRNGYDDMEITSSLKFWIDTANYGYVRKLIVNDSRLINSVKSYLINHLFQYFTFRKFCSLYLWCIHVNNYYEVADLINILLDFQASQLKGDIFV